MGIRSHDPDGPGADGRGIGIGAAIRREETLDRDA
jgi:hypothetical protein